MDHKLTDDIALKNVVISISCVTKDNVNFILQIYLEKLLFLK